MSTVIPSITLPLPSSEHDDHGPLHGHGRGVGPHGPLRGHLRLLVGTQGGQRLLALDLPGENVVGSSGAVHIAYAGS